MRRRYEFYVRRLREDARTRRIAVPILAVCVVLASALSVYGLMTGKGMMSLGPALIMASVVIQIPLFLREAGRYEQAANELEMCMRNPSRPLSNETQQQVARLEKYGTNELKQLVIAYGIMGVFIIGMGVLLLVLLWGDESNLGLLGFLLLAGGVTLLVMAYKAWSNLRLARELERLPR